MTIDIDQFAADGPVRREVRSGERDGTTTKIVVAGRRYSAEQTDLWDAISNPERLPRWFLPVSGDLRRGGRYQFEGNAGGVIERCDPPELIGITWEFAGGMSWVEVQLTPDGDGTLFELRHEAPVDPHWDTYGPGAVGVGWDLGLLGLGLHLASGAGVDPGDFEAWSVSEAGKQFVISCSDGWTEADIAGGEDPRVARSAGVAVTRFYTTPPGEADPGAKPAD